LNYKVDGYGGHSKNCKFLLSIENSPLLKLFNIQEGKKITAAVMVGYPKYSYKRLVERNPLEVTFI